ncbi:MAG: molybdopterin-synthase adenylyltransferase MoeB [Rhodospirillaceae bacterium]|jgi:molybdopterin-synthase adenylyltransferase|nr:molybdopterin-synthase adenylyltransferase MoeB [Rhodospirillaceae bacterium]MBT4219239.1 molybdopterin-synthase adenylyltransferase MoeB [Rhodospirillaceae bacterium]MBT4463153.1 molybdopterin-synthase adenylyltransferase MoeB [Rhodospirillaceae bacterium]MBT5014410.1 molybdopterin-synthase adenylyltransferase MoeB [Rhodospirillaceae bacterium]MBT5309689.1 molybdopterin-synthase adenylyltransferase MoeB [Rhodospirillaceae bacterium]
MEFNENQINRYARHILLNEIGGAGQASLLGAKVLVIGAGGLGSPVVLYLAAAGVGTIGVVDDDVVDLSNLQRQILHTTQSVGTAKVDSATQTVSGINPDVKIVAHNTRINADNAMALISDYDIVADGSDNFATRFLVNDACYLSGKPLVSAAILRFDGQLYTFKAYEKSDDGTHPPCYRCLFPKAPPAGQVPTCAEAGVLGALCGTLGSLQATEVIKEILGIGDSLAGSMLIYEGLSSEFRKITLKPDPACKLCGTNPEIHDLSAH